MSFKTVLFIIGSTAILSLSGYCMADNGAKKLNNEVEKIGTVYTATINDSTSYVDMHPDLAIHSAQGIPFRYLFALKEAEEAFSRTFHEYRKKRNRELIVGGSLMAVSLVGYVYAFEGLPTPVRHDPWTEEYSEERYNNAKRDRWIAFGASTLVGAVGTFIFARAFRWDSRITGEAGLNYLRIRFLLNRNNESAFDGTKRKELRTFGYYPRYR